MLQTAKLHVKDTDGELAVVRRCKADQRVDSRRGRLGALDQPLAVRIANFEPCFEWRAKPGRHAGAGDRLARFGLEAPEIDVFARKNPAVDRYRQRDVDGNRLAVDFIFDHFGKIADDKGPRRNSALSRPQPPAARADGRVGGDLHAASHVARIIFGLLRIGQRNDRPFEPDGIGRRNPRRGDQARSRHFERTRFMQIQSADAKLHVGPPLSTRGKNIHRHRRVRTCGGRNQTAGHEGECDLQSAKSPRTEAQRHFH